MATAQNPGHLELAMGQPARHFGCGDCCDAAHDCCDLWWELHWSPRFCECGKALSAALTLALAGASLFCFWTLASGRGELWAPVAFILCLVALAACCGVSFTNLHRLDDHLLGALGVSPHTWAQLSPSQRAFFRRLRENPPHPYVLRSPPAAARKARPAPGRGPPAQLALQTHPRTAGRDSGTLSDCRLLPEAAAPGAAVAAAAARGALPLRPSTWAAEPHAPLARAESMPAVLRPAPLDATRPPAAGPQPLTSRPRTRASDSFLIQVTPPRGE
jgi:hypothetical protein